MKINWNNVFILSLIGAVIIFLSFGAWYYFAIKLPQEKLYQENIEQNLKMIEFMQEAGYSQEEIGEFNR